MTYVHCLFVVLTFIGSQAFSQEDSAVKKPVMLLFDGMRNGDSSMIRAAFSPDAIMQTVVQTKDGKTVIENEKVDEFISVVSKPHKEVYDERITFDVIRIDGNLAIAWAPYKFYVGNTFSHCGVDSYQLVKLNGEWKIQYIIDTRRKENCQ